MFLGGTLSDVLPATALIMAIAIVGGVLILQLRNKFKKPPLASMAFTIDELKNLRDEGSISPEEYELAKQSIIDLTKGSTTDSQEKPLK